MSAIPPSSLLSAQFTQTIVSLRERVSVASEESVTGRHADQTKAMSGDIGRAMMSFKAVEEIKAERSALKLREARLESLQLGLGMIQDRTRSIDMQVKAAIGSGDTYAHILAARDARAALADVFSALNIRVGDRFLFSGDAALTQPLGSVEEMITDLRALASAAATAADFGAALDTYFNTPGGGWQQSIFRGTTTASDEDMVTANEPSIVGIVRNLAVIVLSSPSEPASIANTDPAIALSASDDLATAHTRLIDLRASRGVIQERLANRLTLLDAEETIMTGAFNSLTARDQYQAASELRQLETSLEASYLLTRRLANLTLLNFLK